MSADKPAEAREFWLYADYDDPYVDGYSCYTEEQPNSTFEIEIHVIEYAAVKTLKAELATMDKALAEKNEQLGLVLEENERYQAEMRKINQGIPSEWSYAILQKQFDEKCAELDEWKRDFQEGLADKDKFISECHDIIAAERKKCEVLTVDLEREKKANEVLKTHLWASKDAHIKEHEENVKLRALLNGETVEMECKNPGHSATIHLEGNTAIVIDKYDKAKHGGKKE